MVGGVQSLVDGEGAAAGAGAAPETPEAKSLIGESSVKFANLDSEQAMAVAGEAFPEVVDRRLGGPPSLPAGQSIAAYPDDFAAQVDLGGGMRGLVETLEPMAVETSPGERLPIDLGLSKAGDAFEPVRPAVGVVIPQRLGEGVQVPALGLSLTPVGAEGSPLGGAAGVVDGAGVFYANTQTDTDTLVKPTTTGFATDSMLRSASSVEQLNFRVGMPSGASLVSAKSGSGGAEVVEEGAVIAVVRPPAAVDAAGRSVPVSMRVEGDLLVLTVSAGEDEYQRPISVDPELRTKADITINESSNWVSHGEKEATFKHEWWSHTLELYNSLTYIPGEYVYGGYHTDGDSKIYKLESSTISHVQKGRALLEFLHEGAVEEKDLLGENVSTVESKAPFCVKAGCPDTAGGEGNVVWYKLEATEPDEDDSYGLYGALWNTSVYIAQEKEPEAKFNTGSEKIASRENRTNVLYGSGSWLSPSQGAYEIQTHDGGVGVSFAAVSGPGSGGQQFKILEEGLCKGLQCNENYDAALTYKSGMPDGEDSYEAFAEDAMGLIGYSLKTIKVDATPPRNIGFSGMPEFAAEIRPVSRRLTVHATDGTKPVPSSGVKSISVSVDGGQNVVVPGTTCPEGECTATGEYTLKAESLSEGVHRLVLTAADNAGNLASKEFLFYVRHTSSVAVGPGSVEATNGQFELASTDVSLAGTGGVSRVYRSQSLTAGVEGPLGPQWALSDGGGEQLDVLPNGSVAVMAGDGGRTTYTLNSKDEFESPKGDGNVKIEYKASEHERRYVLSDATAGTETVFEQPEGDASLSPSYSNQFGSEGSELAHPESDATDAKGDVWVTDFTNDRVQEFSAAGTLMRTFGTEGSGVGQFVGPWGIAVNQGTGDVYVTDQGNSRVQEFNSSGEFMQMFGWGVKNGSAELQICTSECRAGIAGSGAGQVYTEAGVAVDSSGDVWVADYGNNRVQEFNEKGSYLQSFGTEGSGNGQFKGPLNIAFSGANVYVTDYGNNRVQEFSAAGKYEGTIGKEGKETGQFINPRGIGVEPSTGNLYVTDAGNNRVQEFTASGTFVTTFGTAGSEPGQLSAPTDAAVSASGGIYVTDYNNSRVEEWSRSTWWPTSAKGPLSSETTYTYQSVLGGEGRTSMEPAEVLSPAPAGVSCGTKIAELKRGCRALAFKYAETTTASGENPSEWGEYKGRLSEIVFHSYNPVTKAMAESVVAQYSYDKQGRLRAEWDPRISPALKTTYGYDAEGHVTAMTPAGQQIWAFVYGGISGEPGTGRLLKATRAQPPAHASEATVEEKLREQEIETKYTEAPKLVGTAQTYHRMSINYGTWTQSPVVYDYQWEECNSSGEECAPIDGATNANYTPTAGDIGHKLVAVVTATNGGGSQTASSVASAVVVNGIEEKTAPVYSSTFGSYGTGNGQLREPEGGLATDSSGDVWVTDTYNNRLEEFNAKGEFVRAVGSYGSGAGQFGWTSGVAVDSKGNVWATDQSNERVDEFSSEGVFVKAFGWGVANGENKLEVCTVSCRGGIQGAGSGEFYIPEGIAVDSKGDVFVADRGNKRVQEFSSEGLFVRSISQTEEREGPFDVTVDSSGDVWVAYAWDNKIGEFNPEGKLIRTWGTQGSEPGKLSIPYDLAIGPNGDVWVSEYGNSRVQIFTPSGEYLSGFGSQGNGPGQFKDAPHGIAFYGLNVYVLDSGAWWENTGNSRVETWLMKTEHAEEGPLDAPEPGSAVEYRLPVSGGGLPTLTREEVEKWGQKDNGEYEDNDPVEGMAIFPPDEPQGWPASKYTRATIDYVNEKGMTVNTASPSGAISTTEYNETNEVIRTLSPDNRLAALKETGKTVAASELLDTRTEYDPEDSEIVKVLGPQHKVKLSSGAEVEAREVTHNYYDEESKEAEEETHESYRLVTKTTRGARLANGEEKDVRTAKTSYTGTGNQENLGWRLREPTSVTTDPGGLNLTSTTTYNPTTGAVVETTTPAGKHSESNPPTYSSAFGSYGTGNGQLREPEGGLATDSSGDVWVTDTYNDRLEEFNGKGEFVRTVGSYGSGAGQFGWTSGVAVDSKGNVWATDEGNERVDEFNGEGVFIKMFGWGVANGENKLEVCTVSCRAGIQGSGGGEFYIPEGIAVDSKGDVFVADRGNKRVQEFTSEGAFVRSISQAEEKEGPFDVAVDSSGDLWVAYAWDNKIAEFNPEGKLIRRWGTAGSEPGKLSIPYDLSVGPEGNIWVSEYGNNRVQVFTQGGRYLSGFGSQGNGPGQFKDAPHGLAFYGSSIYVLDSGIWWENTGNSRIEKWTMPAAGKKEAPDTQYIYYSAGANTSYPGCGEHPEWANLLCQTQPTAQPEASGLPELPITTLTYNMWDEVETTTEKTGSATRTRTQTYDSAGRALTSEETSTTEDKTLPKVTNKYNTSAGWLETQSTTTGGKTETIASKYNTLGQLVTYTDAAGGITEYAYEEGGDDRLKKIGMDGVEGEKEREKGSQTYSYDPTTGFMTKLVDSAAGEFTATYDAEGRMLTDGYPDGLTATYTYNQVGAATGIEYVKSAHCATKCPETWFSDTALSSIHGQTLSQTSTLAKESYLYDEAGRLTETQETPAGKGCKARIYAYNEESDRTSETTRESATETCPTEGGTAETHSYDTANRLDDTGTTYEALGNATKLPAADAGEHALTSTYYVDSQLATQEQNGKSIKYSYDPAGRALETEAKEGATTTASVSHYSGPGEALTWASEASGGTEKWTRNIPGIDGALAAIQTSAGTTRLQLHDLQGDIIGEAALSETETKLLSSYNSTEFGVPTTSSHPKYSWLGAGGIASELSSGVVAQGGASYVPQIARDLQTAPVVAPGAFPNGSGTPSPHVSEIPGWAGTLANGESAATVTEWTAKLKAREEEALRKCEEEGGCGAEVAGPPEGEGEEEYGENEAGVGDPTVCVAIAYSPTRTKKHRHTLNIKGGYICGGEYADVIGVTVQMCVQEQVAEIWKNAKCRPVQTFYGKPAMNFQFTFRCTPGKKYQTWFWIYPFGHGIWIKDPATDESSHYGEVITC